jgi:quinol monooxygenase YgiN
MFYFTKAAFLLLLGAIPPTNCLHSHVIYGNGDGIAVTYYEGLDCEEAPSTFTSSFVTTTMLDEDVACLMDTDEEDGKEIYYKIHYGCTKDALTKMYSMGCSDDTCSDCTNGNTTQGTETWDDWTMYPTADHCYSQTMSNGNEQSWMISSNGYDDWKLYIDTIVDNSCIDVVSNDGDDDDDDAQIDNGIPYGNGDGIPITIYEGLDCKEGNGTFSISLVTTNMIKEDVACYTDSDEDGNVFYVKNSFDCTKDALIKTYSMGCSDDTCSDCTNGNTTQGTESWADWAMYPPSDHCYSQTMSNGNEQSWMISSKGYDDYKLYIDTIVDNSCIEGTGEATATATATCGKCLPIMEGDNAYINARLWKTNETEPEYFGYSADDIAPLLQQLPGFIKYAATTTQDPYFFLFYDVFDSEENSKAAHKKAKEVNAKLELDEKLIHEYMGEIYWSGAPDDCVKGYHQAGDYLSSRFFSPDLDRCKDAECTSSFNYEVWKDMDSFESYISSYAVDNTESFYITTFNNKEDAHEANDLALSTTNLDPTTKLIATTIGQVAFDFTCSGNNFEYATCMTIGTYYLTTT